MTMASRVRVRDAAKYPIMYRTAFSHKEQSGPKVFTGFVSEEVPLLESPAEAILS